MKSTLTAPWSTLMSVIIPIHQNQFDRYVTHVDALISIISKVVGKMKSDVSTNESS